MPSLLIADDHPLFRAALRGAAKDAVPDLEVREADSLDSVLARLDEEPGIDLVLLDLHMPASPWLPGMRERGYGRIVNIGSIHSLVASPYKSAYVAAKHGLLGLSKVVALETADTDITINTICPTYVKTPLVDKQIADQARTRGIPESQVVSEVMLKPMPKGVFIGFDELAGITAFLMSAHARNITGHTIDVDGGWTVQ